MEPTTRKRIDAVLDYGRRLGKDMTIADIRKASGLPQADWLAKLMIENGLLERVGRDQYRLVKQTVQAPHGEKTVGLAVRFFSNDIADAQGHIVPGHIWESGVVRVERNAAHGLAGGKSIPFHSLPELLVAIESALIESGLIIHSDRGTNKARKYRAA
jgi:hypothetical protein